MAELHMEHGESAILRLDSVWVADVRGSREVVLTNKYIHVVETSTWTKRVLSDKKYPISQIPIIGNRANVRMLNEYGTRKCIIQLASGDVLELNSEEKTDFGTFCSEINRLLTGIATTPTEKTHGYSDDFAEIFSAFNPFGGKKSKKQQAQQVEQAPQHVKALCYACHAPIRGYSGQVVTCEYCGTGQRL